MAATVVPSSGKTIKDCWGCSKCRQLFYCSDFTKEERIGLCPGGDRHKAGCGEFRVIDDGTGEAGWRFCTQCTSLYLASSATAGVCVGNGSHKPDTTEFTLKKEARDTNVSYLYPWGR